MESYPKVLIINYQSIYKKNATGITLESLWNNWPKDRMKEFYIESDLKYEKIHCNSKCVNDYFPIRKLIERIYHKKFLNDNNNANSSLKRTKKFKKKIKNICN